MQMRSVVLAAVVATTAVTAHAVTVQVQIEVRPDFALIGHIESGLWAGVIDPSFVPTPFSMTLEFDTANTMLYPTSSSSMGFSMYNNTIIQNGTLGETPYTEALSTKLPPVSEAIWPPAVQISYGGSTSSYGTGSTRTLWETLGINHSVLWQTADASGSETISYSRGINFVPPGVQIDLADFKPKGGPQIVEWLQAHTGEAWNVPFTEQYSTLSRKTLLIDNQWVIDGNPDGVVSSYMKSISGTAWISSVTVVPEPSTALMVGVGLLVMGSVVRRRVR
jgi:hypothetical protein